MNLDEIFGRAASDERRGASEIETDLITALLEARDAWRTRTLRRGAGRVVEAHPVMANLRRLRAVLHASDGQDVVDELHRRLEVLRGLEVRLGALGGELVGGCRRVVTISRSSAVRALLGGAADAGWDGEVVVLDGTSSGGGREQAELLREVGIDACSRPDGTLWSALGGDPETAVALVGADAVGVRRAVNAQGTRTLCELALVRGVAVCVVADSGKDIAEHEIDEVVAAARVHSEPGPGRRWPVFETVPLRLVRERVSERGVQRLG